MGRFYVACELGSDYGRVLLGELNRDGLTVSEVHRFKNEPIQTKDSTQWNIQVIYNEVLEELRTIATYDEPVESVSFTSWPSDYLLFDSGGALLSPTYHRQDDQAEQGMEKVLAKVPLEDLYEETGVQPMPTNTLFQ